MTGQNVDFLMRILAWPAFKNRADNPYNSLLYGPMASMGVEVHEFSPARLLRFGYVIWHLHWPDNFLCYPRAAKCAVRLGVLFGLLDFARAKGIKLVWTVHNLRSHERLHPRLEHWFWRAFTQRLDGYISLSEAGRQAALENYPPLRRVPGFVIPHGHYREIYPNDVKREEARRQLKLPPDAAVLVHVGKLRPYKNVPHLIRTFRQVADPRAVLLIAGQPPTAAYARELMAEAAGDPRVRLISKFIPTGDMQLYLRAADLAALPYVEVLNSGTALLALSFDLPVLVPRQGSMQELQQLVGPQWMQTYAGELTPELIEDGMCWARNAPRPEHAPLDTLDWRELAAKLVDAYGQICHGERLPNPTTVSKP